MDRQPMFTTGYLKVEVLVQLLLATQLCWGVKA